jgi:hypothetical protein
MLYGTYLVAGVAMVLVVGAVLFRSAPAFLREDGGDAAMAVNRLRLTGFVLLALGLVLLVGSVGPEPAREVRLLTAKLGVVAVILGVLLFTNLTSLAVARRQRLIENRSLAPYPYPVPYPQQRR